MDWKRLVQFALVGSSDLEQYAVLLVRVSLGAFFAVSGANKLFVAGSTQTMYETLIKAKVPFPRLTRLEAGNDWMPCRCRMLGCMLARRSVTTSDVPTLRTPTEMKPPKFR